MPGLRQLSKPHLILLNMIAICINNKSKLFALLCLCFITSIISCASPKSSVNLLPPDVLLKKYKNDSYLVRIHGKYRHRFMTYILAKKAIASNKELVGTSASGGAKLDVEYFKRNKDGALVPSGIYRSTTYSSSYSISTDQNECKTTCKQIINSAEKGVYTRSAEELCNTDCSFMRKYSLTFVVKNAKDIVSQYELENGVKREGVDYIVIYE